MKYYAIIPAHNEEAFMSLTLQSLAEQTVLPAKVVVVNDNSTDGTAAIVSAFAEKHPWISLVNKQSNAVHMPGSKVIQAFHAGQAIIDDHYDIIVKLDADLILPPDYFETILDVFKTDEKVGMAGGFAYIEKTGTGYLKTLPTKTTFAEHLKPTVKRYFCKWVD
jgi:glycosyltransferase involved in cell wall biosynthesis